MEHKVYCAHGAYINRSFNQKIGVELIPDYKTGTFAETPVILIDWDKPIPDNIRIDHEQTVKVTMPIETYLQAGKVKII